MTSGLILSGIHLASPARWVNQPTSAEKARPLSQMRTLSPVPAQPTKLGCILLGFWKNSWCLCYMLSRLTQLTHFHASAQISLRVGALEGCESVTSSAHRGSSSMMPLQPQVPVRFFTVGSPATKPFFQVLFPQLVQNLDMSVMTTPQKLPGGYYQRRGCLQDSTPAHMTPSS